MFKNVWDFIKGLFKINSATTSSQVITNERYARNYKDIRNINFTSIFANKFASLVKNESEIIVTDSFDEPSQRTVLLNNAVKETFGENGKKIISRMLGTGGVALVPYVSRGKIYTDIVSQDRIYINKKLGNDIYDVTILAETLERDNTRYFRWINYVLDENNTYTITSFASTQSELIPLTRVPEWKDIEPKIQIANCEKLLLAFIKSPTDNRSDDDTYGVPITYGCDRIINEIYECLDQIAQEFRLKEAFVGLDSRMFGRDGQTPRGGLFKLFKGGNNDGDFWEIFDPAIRESSYYARLANLYDILEKQVGSSAGVLTEKTSQYATATEIKSSNYDTYAIVDDIRRELERGMETYVYACNVLADFYNLAPYNEYKVICNWSYALIENSAETWEQYTQAVSMGIYGKAEARQFLVANESLEESKKKIAEIEKENFEIQKQQLDLQNSYKEDDKEEYYKEKEEKKEE